MIIDSNITSENLLNFKFYAQWAGSAYCNDDSQQGQSVVCSGDVCPELQSHNASIIGSFKYVPLQLKLPVLFPCLRSSLLKYSILVSR